VTKDHSLSAQWEHTVLVTASGHEVLTRSAGSLPRPPRPDRGPVTAALRQTAPAWDRWRDELSSGRQALREAYYKHSKPQLLLRRHAQLIDRIVRSVWAEAGLGTEAALVATGGYGRGALFPAPTSIFWCCSQRTPA